MGVTRDGAMLRGMTTSVELAAPDTDLTAVDVRRQQTETAEVAMLPTSPDAGTGFAEAIDFETPEPRFVVRVTRDTCSGVAVEAGPVSSALTPLLCALIPGGGSRPAWARAVVFDVDSGGANEHLVNGAMAGLEVLLHECGRGTPMASAIRASMDVLANPKTTHGVAAAHPTRRRSPVPSFYDGRDGLNWHHFWVCGTDSRNVTSTAP